MKWKLPYNDAKRTIRRFLFLPRTMPIRLPSGNVHPNRLERRWLCWATWTQTFRDVKSAGSAGAVEPVTRRWWEDTCWERDDCPT